MGKFMIEYWLFLFQFQFFQSQMVQIVYFNGDATKFLEFEKFLILDLATTWKSDWRDLGKKLWIEMKFNLY